MRKFYLENELGERKPLNGEDGIFLTDPAGLGVSYGNSYADLGAGFFRRVEEKQPQGVIPCSLTFMRGAYEKYKDFADWALRAETIYLVYKPLNVAYYRRVELSYLTRDEQAELWDLIGREDATPSLSQALRMKQLSREAKLTPEVLYAILTEEKPNQKEQIRIKTESLRKYFPRNYSAQQMEREIIKLLEARYRAKNRGER